MNLMLLNNLPNASVQLKAIFQAFSDWIFVLDEKGTILDYQAGAVACFPGLPEASVGHRIQDFLPDDVRDDFLKAFQWLGQSQSKDVPPFEYSLKLENAEQWFEARLVRAQEQIIVILRDITKHKKAEEKTQRQLKRLAALRSIDLAIASSLDLNLALSVVLSQVTAQLNVDAADILLLNPQNSMLEFANGVGFRTDALQHTHLQMGEGLAGLAALKREVINIPNLKGRKTGFLRSPKFVQEDFHSYYSVPLIAKGRVRGVLETFQRTPLIPDSEWLDFLDMLAGQAAIAIENSMLLKELQRTNFELTLAYNTTIEGWSRALDLRDRDTEGHTQRVTDMALKLARRLGLSEAELVHIRRGALLHDIGKMAVPDSILLKPGPLSEEEWDVIRQHPRYAYELLSSISYLGPALDIPHFHHEKWDGTGYPHRLKDNQIPLYARLFAVIDVYDALTSNRPYRQAWSREEAFTYIRDEKGKHFDPAIAIEFLSMIQTG
jgi:putative nucleotidyltransferase with HDIG domain